MTQVHIFDFDGTLFHSPAPSDSVLAGVHGRLPEEYRQRQSTVGSRNCSTVNQCLKDVHTLKSKLNTALVDGGLGWFQSLHTLSPPYVPLHPPLEEWYLSCTVERLLKLVKQQREEMESSGSRSIYLYVLTGRDVKYQKRIESLLSHAGLLSYLDGVFLKPTETFGTVRYKLSTFVKLAAKHSAERMYYYEDRPQQGAQLLNGMQYFIDAYMNFNPRRAMAEAYWLKDVDTPLPYSTSLAAGPVNAEDKVSLEEMLNHDPKYIKQANNYASRWMQILRDTANENANPSKFDTIGVLHLNDPQVQKFLSDPNQKFYFIMMLVGQEYDNSTSMLDRDAVTNLLVDLLIERDAYEERTRKRPSESQSGSFRGRGHNTNRGRGYHRGRGRGKDCYSGPDC